LEVFHSSSETGLSEQNALENTRKYGPNILPEAIPRSRLDVLLEQFKSLPVALLGIAAGVSFATGGAADAVVILGVIALNGVIGYVTESEAEKTIESFKNIVRPGALVLRDGEQREIGLKEIVPGDVLVLRPGVYVAADCRLITANHLSIDESAMTGESFPVMKSPSALQIRDIPICDRVNMIFMGTLVTGGQGLAVVVATGRLTELGRLQLLVGEAKAPETPMERQLRVVGNQLVFISSAVCGVVFVIGLLRGLGFVEMFKTSIALAVAAVPEGLPTVATTTLALGIRNMKKRQVLIRSLKAVETLGSVQTICFDKTGTVTQNKMTVQRIWTDGKRIEVLQNGLSTLDCNADPYLCEEFLTLMRICVLCNESVVAGEKGTLGFHGSSTENALMKAAVLAGVDVVQVRNDYRLLEINHRSEDRNFMATLHENTEGEKLIFLKGSPLEVLALCDWYMKEGERLPLNEEVRFSIEMENERMASDALRVLGFAFSSNGVDFASDDLHGLVWLGLVGMGDPVREGVKALIPRFHEAGIDTIMITGDQSSTAYSIGKSLGLSNSDPLEILDSTQLADIEPDALKALAERVHVFARVSPANKLQIVQALQRAGRIVAMTGDGINDGPALKAADIGVALGASGTDIAREVADVILEKDDLETMIVAVSQGRTIYSNIRKSLQFILATNFSEIMVMFAASTIGLGYPLTAMQLLWINLISDVFPGLALALEPPEPDVLKRPPRDPKESIIQKSDFKRITFEASVISASALSAYVYGVSRYGIGPRAGTLAFQSLTLSQLLHAISCRSKTHGIFSREKLPANKYLNIAIGGSIALQLMTMIIPGLRTLLGIAPISLTDAVLTGVTAVVPLLINETKKEVAKEKII
jgi:Ca2+-transporting ATPase